MQKIFLLATATTLLTSRVTLVYPALATDTEDEREPALIITISAKSIAENVSGVGQGRQRHSYSV